ncbi:Chorismate mutase [Tolypocladium capitatum]|uniref:Chorismate mutase n=1 Tax=Tolypocladium capitatum TaxID=45235 RepID=A0A2K3QMI0_9HYPO|nr:Chorismate mutase [Tolypocladium capitatum]
MDAVIDNDMADGSKALDLSRIRFQLMSSNPPDPWRCTRADGCRRRMEDTITFHLIERVQFALNKTIYTPGAIHIPNSDLSFFDWYLSEQEKLQSLIRRYESPDEYPFFPGAVQKPILKPVNYPQILHPNDVNVNAEIKSFYVEKFLPAVCPDFGREDRGESQENYGSTATADFPCLQALSRRIHFGKFVAESKFRSDPEKYTRLIQAGDREGIAASITDAAVEQTIFERLRLKAMTYGKDPSAPDSIDGPKINVDAVVSMYKDFVIPLTKEVEVEYLMQRLEPIA